MTTTATPSQVFELVAALLSDTWPVLDSDAVAFLERHSCDVLLAHRNIERAVRVGRWHCPELDVWGAWTTCPPHGIGLSVHLLDCTAAGPTTSIGYCALSAEFTKHLGAPEIIDRNPRSPRTTWTRHKLAVTVDSSPREQTGPLVRLTIHPIAMVYPQEEEKTPRKTNA